MSVPVTADLDDGYGDAGETTRLAIAAGVVGANVEDRLKPLDESVAVVEAIVKAAEAEGVPFALNARTDAFVRTPEGWSHDQVLAEAARRGKAFIEAGAPVVFVPRVVERADIEYLVDALGRGRLTLISPPGAALPSVRRRNPDSSHAHSSRSVALPSGVRTSKSGNAVRRAYLFHGQTSWQSSQPKTRLPIGARNGSGMGPSCSIVR